jgi:hypothetical protein
MNRRLDWTDDVGIKPLARLFGRDSVHEAFSVNIPNS